MPTRADMSVGRRRASPREGEHGVRRDLGRGRGYDTIGEQKREEAVLLRRSDWVLLMDYDAKERQAPPCLASCSLRQQAARQRCQ